MDQNHTNTIMAIALSIMVLIAWQFFYVSPKLDQERRAAEIQAQRDSAESGETAAETDAAIPQSGEVAPSSGETPSANVPSRSEALGQSARIPLETELLVGSINLRGARIDDIKLKNYRETIDPTSPLIELLSPSGSNSAYFAEFGYSPSSELGKLPGPDTEWSSQSKALGTGQPIALEWINEKGIKFQRTIEIDDGYMFTVRDTIINESDARISVTPYGRIARFEKPPTAGIFVLHEGLIGFLGEEGLQEIDYDDLEEEKEMSLSRVDAGWLGITDKYWATALIPGQNFKPKFSYFDNGRELFQSDFLGSSIELAPGAEAEVENRLFAGAKKTELVDGYQESLDILNFDLMIDWGWFYFITKPLFKLLNWLFGIVGNFGVAILIATVIVKTVFLPLANMSYASMAKMKTVQPEMMAIRERFADDKAKQQQEMMALYKREKINPAAGCWPILIQIPVFFALYKVLFVTIEMRHAPFFGWVQDLAAPDPTSIFNLFGLLPFEVGGLFLVGVWPVLMGITMFLQMQMNPTPPDPTQAMIFKWMPFVFTFMLASFPAGLVIYWAWNNFLSILQQGAIMRRHGAKIELVDNLKGMFSRKKSDKETGEPDKDKPKK